MLKRMTAFLGAAALCAGLSLTPVLAQDKQDKMEGKDKMESQDKMSGQGKMDHGKMKGKHKKDKMKKGKMDKMDK